MSSSRKYFAHPTAVVEEGAEIGEGTRIWHFAHVRSGARIGRNCNIGKDVYVDQGAVIGNNVKIQNGVSVYRGVVIEDNVFVGPYAVFTNDKYPRAFSTDWEVVPTVVKEGASIGANATIVCGVTIGRYAMVAAGSVVTRDVPDHALVAGNPARIVGFVCYCGRPLKRLVGERDGNVVLQCDHCGREVSIPKSIYEKALEEKK
ncbi:acyltransferase [Thermofilum pendens]|uniref:Transferase hexapeptide repeat containing protein n=1 Tax=Thermofilum pendens (strain DSM 2475 / Hrk 5) TaxID=368408 RepID=A1RYL6_THEPD|nr:acyltransferase [Thermofilum pendens]ABL78296.1 transferase hexapeptide repeat containing protein [Thermofilum pendens Hrk 5]